MTKPRSKPFASEVRERAVRLVLEHQPEYETQSAAIRSSAAKIGCTAQALRTWVRPAERDAGPRPGLTSDEQRPGLEARERDVRERRRASAILRNASASFAMAELDRRAP